VTLAVEKLGIGKGMGGEERAGFTATATINRNDFGVDWNKPLDGGGVVVGDEVKITLEIEAINEASAPETK
jgi:polyisoprenoid-binding protein YceI